MIKKNLNVIALLMLLIATALPRYTIFGIELHSILTVVVAGILFFDGNQKRKDGNSFGMMNMFIAIGLILMLFDKRI